MDLLERARWWSSPWVRRKQHWRNTQNLGASLIIKTRSEVDASIARFEANLAHILEVFFQVYDRTRPKKLALICGKFGDV
jgi:hypothetical protein